MSETDANSVQETAQRGQESRSRTNKSPDAFRTISEAADELGLQQHVLRFWESKFPQVKPLKRGGGRRYYRPEDIALLTRIRDWLHVEGYTIKGVQKLLRDPAQRNGSANETVAEAPVTAPAATIAPQKEAMPATSIPSKQEFDRELDKAIDRLTSIRDNLLRSLGN